MASQDALFTLKGIYPIKILSLTCMRTHVHLQVSVGSKCGITIWALVLLDIWVCSDQKRSEKYFPVTSNKDAIWDMTGEKYCPVTSNKDAIWDMTGLVI